MNSPYWERRREEEIICKYCKEKPLVMCVKCGRGVCFEHAKGSYKQPYCKDCEVKK